MLRLLYAIVSMTLLPLQPIVGWWLLRYIGAPDGVEMIAVLVWFCSALFQLFLYGGIILAFWKKRGVELT